MKATIICPCCSGRLLHHLSNHREYWFCRHCWSEMPDLGVNQEQRQAKTSGIIGFTSKFSNFSHA